jgi:hypothetical protein
MYNQLQIQKVRKPSPTKTHRRRKLFCVPLSLVVAPYKIKAEEMPRDIFLLQQAVLIDNLIADYIKTEEIDISVRPNKYIGALLEAYDCLVDEIEDDAIKPTLRFHLSHIADPFKSCAKNNCA